MGVAYFAFTSLSTVGFGDLTPRSDLERVIGAVLLLVGVALFTYIMGLFIEMIDELQRINNSYEDGDRLTKFFSALQYLNGKQEIKQELRDTIEQFFEYSWTHDRNLAFQK